MIPLLRVFFFVVAGRLYGDRRRSVADETVVSLARVRRLKRRLHYRGRRRGIQTVAVVLASPRFESVVLYRRNIVFLQLGGRITGGDVGAVLFDGETAAAAVRYRSLTGKILSAHGLSSESIGIGGAHEFAQLRKTLTAALMHCDKVDPAI